MSFTAPVLHQIHEYYLHILIFVEIIVDEEKITIYFCYSFVFIPGLL